MKWISVEESLPCEDRVLLCIEYLDNGVKEIEIGHLSEFSPKSTFEGFCNMLEKRFKKVTHWMPLPGLPLAKQQKRPEMTTIQLLGL